MQFKHHFISGKWSFKEVDKRSNTELFCVGCLDLIYGPMYVNDDHADFAMHKLCAELPIQIQKDAFHPHLLRFNAYGDMIVCDGCGRLWAGIINYRCMYCMFNLDFKCAVAIFNSQLADHEVDFHKMKLIKTTKDHFSHNHQLTHCKYLVPTSRKGTDVFEGFLRNAGKPNCMSCEQDLHGTMIYTCLPCKFVLHESCVNEMPRQVLQSAFHPQHILLPRLIRRDTSYSCGACRKQVHGISFYCNECNIDLHVSCAKYQTRAIKHSCHPNHRLIHLGKSINVPQISCHYCFKDFGDSSFFSCAECDFHVHIECIPKLPLVKQTRRHLHPLVLTTSFLEDDSLEYFCDICEMERNSEHHVYYCKECKYIAHVDCVLFEVINLMCNVPGTHVA